MTVDKAKAYRDILVRAGKTFVQAFISSLTIDGFFGISDFTTLKKIALSVLVGAVAAGISAVWNSFLEWLTVRIGEMEDGDMELTEEEVEAINEEVNANG